MRAPGPLFGGGPGSCALLAADAPRGRGVRRWRRGSRPWGWSAADSVSATAAGAVGSTTRVRPCCGGGYGWGCGGDCARGGGFFVLDHVRVTVRPTSRGGVWAGRAQVAVRGRAWCRRVRRLWSAGAGVRLRSCCRGGGPARSVRRCVSRWSGVRRACARVLPGGVGEPALRGKGGDRHERARCRLCSGGCGLVQISVGTPAGLLLPAPGAGSARGGCLGGAARRGARRRAGVGRAAAQPGHPLMVWVEAAAARSSPAPARPRITSACD